MCFGSSDDGSSREMINMQKDEAKRAAAKEADRQARITQGLGYIKNMFEGAPEMRNVNKKFDWNNFNPAGKTGLPAGFSYKQIPGTAGVAGRPAVPGVPPQIISPASTPQNIQQMTPAARRALLARGGGSSNSGNEHGAGSQNRLASVSTNGAGFYGNEGNEHGAMGSPNNRMTAGTGPIEAFLGTAGTPDRWVIQGPDGRTYEVGSDVIYGQQEATGNKIGDWQQKFKDNYRQSMLDYYEPQVAEQFTDANNETIYGHARAGTLDSTAKLGNVKDLINQNTKNIGDVRTKADTAVNDLGERILKERSAAEAQLYSTENPEVAATAAQRAIENITAEAPPTTPLADLFTIAATGGANAYKGYTNASRINTGFGGGGNSGRNQKVLGA